jgi:beta-galactosidase/beta-glucuronidase
MRIAVLFICLIISLSACQKEYNATIDLSGEWQFQIDSLDIGITNNWFNTDLNDTVTLPGSMTTNGKGFEVSVDTKWTGGIVDSSWYKDEKYEKYRRPGNVKIPFWLQPVKYYAGAAWYKKTVVIPADWKNQYIELNLERCHWETRVWVDDHEVGSQNSLATAHIYDLTNYINPGNHTITILVDNRVKEIDPGINAHSIADHTQSNWNGITGEIELNAKPKIQLADIRIFPDVINGKVSVKGIVANYSNNESAGTLTISTILNSPGADRPKVQIEEKIDIGIENNEIEYDFSLGDELGIWDEFYPNLYTMSLQLKTASGLYEEEIKFGMREFKVDGTRFAINGRPVFLRGTLECAIFQKTGYPPTDPDDWK